MSLSPKADLCPNVEELEAKAASLSENLQVVPISSRTGYGLERLRTYFSPGVTIALLGSSGAGQSTLINTLAGREIMQTGGIREEDSKGRHTTTHRELIELDGVSFIDTPGLRELIGTTCRFSLRDAASASSSSTFGQRSAFVSTATGTAPPETVIAA